MNCCTALEKSQQRRYYTDLEFPFEAPLSCNLPEINPQLSSTNQNSLESKILAIYSYCQKFNNPNPNNSSFFGKTVSYIMDFRKKRVVLEKIGRIEAASVFESLIQDSFVRVIVRQQWTFNIASDSGFSLEANFTLLNDTVFPLNELPFSYLDGNECEIITRSKNPELSDSDWDNWKMEDDAVFSYRDIIYPLFLKAVERICRSVHRETYSVLDIGGGDGELAFSILKEPKISSYTLIEKNEEAIALAKYRAKRNRSQFIKGEKKLQIIKDDATQIDFSKILNKSLVDIIILSGIVADQVLSKKDSETLLRTCKKILNLRGVILIASHSSGYFSTKDYVGMGFKVLNKTGQILNEDLIESFYVLSNN